MSITPWMWVILVTLWNCVNSKFFVALSSDCFSVPTKAAAAKFIIGCHPWTLLLGTARLHRTVDNTAALHGSWSADAMIHSDSIRIGVGDDITACCNMYYTSRVTVTVTVTTCDCGCGLGSESVPWTWIEPQQNVTALTRTKKLLRLWFRG